MAHSPLDSISSFIKNSNGTVTATVSYTYYYAPSYVTGPNTYTVGGTICILGADNIVNNGNFVVVAYAGNGPGQSQGTITYINPTGVTQSMQFAFVKPCPTMLKGANTARAATAFTSVFDTSGSWYPPPLFNSNEPSPYNPTPGCVLSGGATSKILTIPAWQFGPFEYLYMYAPLVRYDDLYPFRSAVQVTVPYFDNSVGGSINLIRFAVNPSAPYNGLFRIITPWNRPGVNVVVQFSNNDGSNPIIFEYTRNNPRVITIVPTSTPGRFSMLFNGVDTGYSPSGFPVGYETIWVVLYTGGSLVSLTEPTTFGYSQPLPIDHYNDTIETPVVQVVSSGTSSAMLPLIVPVSGSPSAIQIKSTTGFTSLPAPSSLSYALQLFSPSANAVIGQYSNTFVVTPVPVSVSPSPLVPYGYSSFSYTFTLPSGVVNTVLDGVTGTSTSIVPYVSSSAGNTIVSFASAGVPPSSPTLSVYANVSGSIVGSNVTTLSFPVPPLVATPSGAINLYKYEFGTYSFTTLVDSSLTLQYTKSATQLGVYLSLSDDSKTVTLSGTPPASYSDPLSLVIDQLDGTTIVGTTTYAVTIAPGHIHEYPASPYPLYQYESISNTFGSYPTLTPGTPIDSLVSAPSLPLGLSFSSDFSNLIGRPLLIQSQKNYQIIGSNSSNGRIVTTILAISVNPPIVRITPSAITFPALTTASTPTATFTALTPSNYYASTFVYSWSPSLPSGLRFTDINGNTQSYGNSFDPPDASNTIILTGTPTMTDAAEFPSSGLVNVTLSGYYRDATNVTTIGTSVLSFQFAETVLMTASASSSLYVGKTLGSNDIVVTAASYFPNTSGITTFTPSAVPAGLTIASNSTSFPTKWWFTGTPTAAVSATYTFTATNSSTKIKSIPLTITINPDIVTFSTTSNPMWMVSRPLDGTFYVRATATSGTAITYTCSPSISTYGLALNGTTGVITGIPTSSVANLSVVFTATDALGASATRTQLFTIQEDVFTWTIPTFSWFQNRAITPYRFTITTTSGRTIQSFSSTNLPTGLALNPSGLLTGTLTGTSGSFTVVATTGFQAPSTASNVFTYTVQPDDLLTLQQNGVDPISNTFSNIPFQTTQYSSYTFVNPTYTVATYPLQYPAPVLSMTSSGLLSGTLPSAPYSNYTVDITANYAGVTGKTTAALSLKNVPTPVLLAGWSTQSSNYPHMASTSSYVFNTSSDGTPYQTTQSWYNYDGDVSGMISMSTLRYPDFAHLGSSVVSVSLSNVLSGSYDNSANKIVWTDVTPTTGGQFACVANDGSNNWMVVRRGYPLGVLTRTGSTGPWTQIGDKNLHYAGSGFGCALSYINGTYVFGQTRVGGVCNVLYSTSPDRWLEPSPAPTFSAVLRFATSNTTIVAVGMLAPEGSSPLSYSSDSGASWVMPTLTSFMQTPYLNIYDIAYANGTWVTCCESPTDSIRWVAYSSDLSNWNRILTSSDYLYSAVAFNGNAWTIAGSIYDPVNFFQSHLVSFDASAWPPAHESQIVDATVFTSGGADQIYFSKLLPCVFSNTSSFTGTLSSASGSMSFVTPTQSNLVLYKYVPYTIPIQVTGASPFIYYYAANVPAGFTFVPDPTGTSAALTGISTTTGWSSTVLFYAKSSTGGIVAYKLGLTSVIPFFVNPKSSAGAYTALLRNEVEANAAQNARDNKTYPEVNPLAGPFMGPRAPDVVTTSNCFLGLCKKPCPTCHTMM